MWAFPHPASLRWPRDRPPPPWAPQWAPLPAPPREAPQAPGSARCLPLPAGCPRSGRSPPETGTERPPRSSKAISSAYAMVLSTQSIPPFPCGTVSFYKTQQMGKRFPNRLSQTKKLLETRPRLRAPGPAVPLALCSSAPGRAKGPGLVARALFISGIQPAAMSAKFSWMDTRYSRDMRCSRQTSNLPARHSRRRYSLSHSSPGRRRPPR